MKAKQIISSFLAACMLLTALPLTVLAENVATPPQQPTVLYGDADNDKDVDLQDTLLIEKYIAGEKVEMNFTNADINASGTVDKEDLNLLKDYLAGNIESLVPNLCTVTFDTNGGSAVEPVQVGKGYSIIREIQVPTKKGFTFDGWVKPDKSPFYQQDDAINTNLTLTATYKALAQTQEINIDSFALMGQ
ncbi:MAG: InlB B-repeat-containing protein, partial [Oscillospiraceae bacterium]